MPFLTLQDHEFIDVVGLDLKKYSDAQKKVSRKKTMVIENYQVFDLGVLGFRKAYVKSLSLPYKVG